MADQAVAAQQVVASGLDATYETGLSTSDNYIIPNDGRSILHVVNGGGSPTTVTIVTTYSAGGLDLPDQTVSVPAGEERMIGPFPTNLYNDGEGKIDVSFSFITSVSFAALRV